MRGAPCCFLWVKKSDWIRGIDLDIDLTDCHLEACFLFFLFNFFIKTTLPICIHNICLINILMGPIDQKIQKSTQSQSLSEEIYYVIVTTNSRERDINNIFWKQHLHIKDLKIWLLKICETKNVTTCWQQQAIGGDIEFGCNFLLAFIKIPWPKDEGSN